MFVHPIYQLEPLFLSYTYYYIGSTRLLSFLSLFLKNKRFNELKRFFQKNAIFLKSHQFVTVPKILIFQNISFVTILKKIAVEITKSEKK